MRVIVPELKKRIKKKEENPPAGTRYARHSVRATIKEKKEKEKLQKEKLQKEKRQTSCRHTTWAS